MQMTQTATRATLPRGGKGRVRTQQLLEAGNYLLIVKPGGCLMIHGAKGVKPRNWQPTTDRLTAALEEGVVVVTGERRTPPRWSACGC